MKLGATEFINPKDYDKPIQDVLIEKTDGGCDFTFECVGNTDLMVMGSVYVGDLDEKSTQYLRS